MMFITHRYRIFMSLLKILFKHLSQQIRKCKVEFLVELSALQNCNAKKC